MKLKQENDKKLLTTQGLCGRIETMARLHKIYFKNTDEKVKFNLLSSQIKFNPNSVNSGLGFFIF